MPSPLGSYNGVGAGESHGQGGIDFSRPYSVNGEEMGEAVGQGGQDVNVQHLSHAADRLSLAPPIRPTGDGERRRESHLDSADQAEGIFDLYERDRDSWRSNHENSAGDLEQDRASANIDAGRTGEDGVEELDDPGSPRSWEGPLYALADVNGNGNSKSNGTPSGYIPTPPIMVTPDRSPMPRMDPHIRNSILSTSTSTSTSLAPSPSKPSRLSPRHPRSSGTGTGNTSASTSQISIAGSSQYPGEDDDAFMVRSTYARLEVQGVHGDGWDPGVERTRGGPQAGKRATMFEVHKGGDVGEAEREYLTNLDRYGFVNEPLRNRSESRLALIPTSPLLKVPKLPTTSPIPPGSSPPPPGPSFAPQADGPSAQAPPSPKLIPGEQDRARRKENERVGKWMKMMSVSKRDEGGNILEWEWRKDALQKKRVYKGVPDRWRMAAWWTLAESRTRDWKGKGREKRSPEAVAQDYRNQIDQPSTHDVQIDLDVPRTISGHTLFVTRYGSGQRALFHVLHCFSLHCDTCGYCQGMGPIAATLLCYYDPERVYNLLVRLHDIYGMHSIFAPGFPGLLEAFYVQERLMEYLLPDVYKSFQRNMISSSAWGTKWYITLFVNTVPFSQQLRLWDALWLDGRDVMIMMSLAILWAFKDLLAAPNATFESILSLLSSYFVAENEDALMGWIRKMLGQAGVRAKMDEWRMDWAKLVREGKSDTALL